MHREVAVKRKAIVEAIVSYLIRSQRQPPCNGPKVTPGGDNFTDAYQALLRRGVVVLVEVVTLIPS